jgi:DNA-binding NarL/FixJ family response regulator
MPSSQITTQDESGQTHLAQSAKQHPIRVLVVDDHLLVRLATRRRLQEIPGLHVVGEAVDGLEAVALARTLSPDLIIMDISMPSLDGIEATRRIKGDSPNILILVLTSHNDPAVFQSALEAGANGYVIKGTPSDQFTNAIKSLLSR